MAGLLDEIKKSQYLQMAEQKLQGLLNIPTEAQRFLTNPQAFMSLLGRNELPKETGFAAGATGLPSKDILPGGVLNPPNLAYQQGYEQGEPFSYAAMAAPMALPVGKALAPKAYDALENYMVKTGGMIPLEAWHGTPHNIQGKFDISKVGTGEGAQAYGHGMYFAENPAVAESYKTVAGKGEFVRIGDKVVPTASQEGQLLSDVTKLGRKAAINKYPDQADYIKTINPDNIKFEGGNLYKVDIPDEYIPNMLDWEKPLKEQPKSVQKALAKIDPDLYSKKGMDYDPEELGQMIYQRLSQIDMNKNGAFTGSARNVSNLLNSQGIKGIRYNDAGSRGATGGTSNFVVFDPTDVKILEKNNMPVEGLLD